MLTHLRPMVITGLESMPLMMGRQTKADSPKQITRIERSVANFGSVSAAQQTNGEQTPETRNAHDGQVERSQETKQRHEHPTIDR